MPKDTKPSAAEELASAERVPWERMHPLNGNRLVRLAGDFNDWADLSTRTSRTLRREGFATPQAAARLSDDALLLVDGFGRKGLQELRDFVGDGRQEVPDGHAEQPAPDSDRVLRFLADGYEQAQRKRIAAGEQIRAVLQGRDETWGERPLPGEGGEVDERGATADDILAEIARGESTGPVPILGRMYARAWGEEVELKKEMEKALKGTKTQPGHVCWPWLSLVKGIGPTLACKLLARLDPRKASTPSGFWAYCGLATVPGERYHCAVCGLVRDWPVGYNVTGKHQALGTPQRPCVSKVPVMVWDEEVGDYVDTGEERTVPNLLVKIAGPEDGVRAAQPRPAKGQRSSYDQYAKKVMYLVGTGFLKVPGGKYEQVYRKSREKLDRERPGWPDGRKHLTALRAAEKLFLSHLWLVWREALGLPVTDPYVFAVQEHAESSRLGPWDMVG